MVKVTVLYNIAAGASVEDFLTWRTTEHQRDNAARPGVLRTDFYVGRDLNGEPPRYRFITESFYADMATLEGSFLTERSQATIAQQVRDWQLEDFTFIISEERSSSAKG